jgi:hypothetical protein
MKATRHVHLTITVAEDGTATIEIPHGKNRQRDANAAASFTDKLGKALGPVLERHIGDHDHHHHDHDHDHDHVHN